MMVVWRDDKLADAMEPWMETRLDFRSVGLMVSKMVDWLE